MSLPGTTFFLFFFCFCWQKEQGTRNWCWEIACGRQSGKLKLILSIKGDPAFIFHQRESWLGPYPGRRPTVLTSPQLLCTQHTHAHIHTCTHRKTLLHFTNGIIISQTWPGGIHLEINVCRWEEPNDFIYAVYGLTLFSFPKAFFAACCNIYIL